MCRPRVANSSTATASTPLIALPAPNSVPAPQVTPAANAPSTTPTTGSARQRPAAQRSPRRVSAVPSRTRKPPNAPTTRSIRSLRPETLAESNVAITASVAIAARSTGSATAAPVPSPSRMPRSTIGSSPSCASASVCAGSVERCPACHHAPGPGRQPFGHQGRRGHHHAVEQYRGAPHGGLRQKAGHGGQVGATGHPQQPDRVGTHRVRAVQRVADGRGLADPPSVVDAGAAADHRDRLGVGQRGDQHRCRGGVSDAHIAGDQQVGAGVHLLVGDGAARRDGGGRLVCGQRVLDGDVAAAATHLVGADRRRRGVGVHRDVDHPHRGTGDAGQHVDGRAAGVEVGHHLRGHLGRKRRHTRFATPWSPANTTTRARSNCRGGQLPWHAATHTDRSSRRPSAPGGLVSVSWRARAAAGGVGVGRRDGGKVRGNPSTPSFRFDRHGHSGDHQHHSVARGGQSLVELAQRIGEPSARLGGGHHGQTRPRD